MALPEFKPSIFNYVFCPIEGNPMIWNSFTGSILRLNSQETEVMRNGKLSKLVPERLRQLADGGFLIPNDTDELSRLFAAIERNAQSPWLDFRILTTTACNASCAYCYERGTQILTMNRETAEQTAHFIAARHRDSNLYIPVHLEWFGGEPLLNRDAIDSICHELRSVGVAWYSTMMSNSVLFDSQIIKDAVDSWQLRRVQTTLDGAGKRHEAAKGLPSGSFSRILENIHILLDSKVVVRIRINFDHEDAINELIDCMSREFPGGIERLGIYICPLYKKVQQYPAEIMERIIGLNRRLIDVGLAKAESFYTLKPRSSRCFAAYKGGYTIAPNGKLYNCSHNMSPEQCVGTIWSYDYENSVRQAFIPKGFSDKCKNCVLLPMCLGGCRAAELDIADMPQCHLYKSVLDKVLAERVHLLQLR